MKVSGYAKPFEWISVQGIAMFLIGTIFFVLVLLIIEISRYYDPNKLCAKIDIDGKFEPQASNLAQELKSLNERESNTN